MPVQFQDLNGGLPRILGGYFNLPLTATGTFTLAVFPPFGRYYVVYAICLTNPIGITGTLSGSFGSGINANDFFAAASITVPTFGIDTVIVPPSTGQIAGSTWPQYAPSSVISFKITAAATTGTASVFVVGANE